MSRAQKRKGKPFTQRCKVCTTHFTNTEYKDVCPSCKNIMKDNIIIIEIKDSAESKEYQVERTGMIYHVSIDSFKENMKDVEGFDLEKDRLFTIEASLVPDLFKNSKEGNDE